MKQEMININANLVAEPTFSSFEKDEETVEVTNFTLVKKYGKGKEYINCAAYGEKTEVAKGFEKGDLIHIFGYFKEREKDGKTYKNFVVKSYNKIEKKENRLTIKSQQVIEKIKNKNMRIRSIITQIISARILSMNMQGLMRMKEFREQIPKREMNSTV